MFDHLKHEYKKIVEEIISGAEYTERCTHAKKLHKKSKSCGVSLLVLATNCEFKEPLNQEHLQNVVDECSKQFHFYNWAFCHSRKVLNEGNNTGDFGRPGYLDKSQRYYELYLHLNNFDGDYDDLYTHIMEVCEYGE